MGHPLHTGLDSKAHRGANKGGAKKSIWHHVPHKPLLLIRSHLHVVLRHPPAAYPLTRHGDDLSLIPGRISGRGRAGHPRVGIRICVLARRRRIGIRVLVGIGVSGVWGRIDRRGGVDGRRDRGVVVRGIVISGSNQNTRTVPASAVPTAITASATSPAGIACCGQDHKKSDQDNGERQNTFFHCNPL
jgi:hypothetical protein